MTERLRQAIAEAEQLPEQEQDAVAEILLAEIAAERRWQILFSDPRSPTLLERMATDAIAEDDAQRTLDLRESEARYRLNASSNTCDDGGKSQLRTKRSASGAPCMRSMPLSSHSTESGPS